MMNRIGISMVIALMCRSHSVICTFTIFILAVYEHGSFSISWYLLQCLKVFIVRLLAFFIRFILSSFCLFVLISFETGLFSWFLSQCVHYRYTRYWFYMLILYSATLLKGLRIFCWCLWYVLSIGSCCVQRKFDLFFFT